MKKAIKRILRKIFIFILVAFSIYLIISNIDLIRKLASGEKINVVIDADAANRNDDLFSILRLVKAEEVEIRGLLSAQWRLVDLENDSTTALNREIHSLLIRNYHNNRLPLESGSEIPLAYSGNGESNLAADAIIRIVSQLPYQAKVNMICLGSATNLATAISRNPGISDKIICYITGPSYDPAHQAWNKSDPVTRLDLEAMNILLNEERLEIHLLPANIAEEMVLTKEEIRLELTGTDTASVFIRERCLDRKITSDTIPCPSLALTKLFLNPDMASGKQLLTPPENTQRKIYVYTKIDTDRMKKDLWKSLSPGN